MNKRSNLLPGIISLFSIVTLASCYSSNIVNNDPALRGMWTMQNHASVKYISLVDDGTLLLQKTNDSIYTGNYRTNHGRLLIKEQPGRKDWLDFRYTIRNDSLLLDNGLKHFVLKRRTK